MFKKKLKPLTTPLSKDEADKTRHAFFDGIRKLAKEHGVDCYITIMEYATVEDGHRGLWLTKDGLGDYLRSMNLITWAYGEHRGRMDLMLEDLKSQAIRQGRINLETEKKA